MLQIERILCGAYEENAYLVSLSDRDDQILIDPGDGYQALLRAIALSKKRLEAICLTHAHFDHILGAPALLADSGADLYCHALDMPYLNDVNLNLYNWEVSVLPPTEGLRALSYPDLFEIAGLRLEVLHTPGHTPGGVCLYLPEEGVLFSGDTLFAAGFGRVDFPGSSSREMRQSLRRLFTLPEETRVYPGHGESTTIGREKARHHLL